MSFSYANQFNTNLSTYANTTDMAAIDGSSLLEGYGGYCLSNGTYYQFTNNYSGASTSDIVLSDLSGKWIPYQGPFLYMNQMYIDQNNTYFFVPKGGVYMIATGNQTGTQSGTTPITIPVTGITANAQANGASIAINFNSITSAYGTITVSTTAGNIVVETEDSVGTYDIFYCVFYGKDYLESL